MITEEEENNLNQAIENDSIAFNDRLVYDKLTFYYISLPILLLGNILGALLLSAMQINSVDMNTIAIWLLVSFIMFLYQIYHYYLFKNETEENKLRDANIWLDKYYTNILLNYVSIRELTTTACLLIFRVQSRDLSAVPIEIRICIGSTFDVIFKPARTNLRLGSHD